MNALPNDHAARERIRTDLTTNMLVEAGAGSGKTTSLVDRLLEHVRTGSPIERLTAVTFTRKAANELRERFQLKLERQIQEDTATPQELARYLEALHGIDRAYVGTIHGFCARLLRERPLEVGIDPDFQETSGEDWDELRRQFWRLWIERAKRDGDVGFAAIEQVGIEPQQLEESFELVVRYPDVEFPLEDQPRPRCCSLPDGSGGTSRQSIQHDAGRGARWRVGRSHASR
jgi:ATP-dependent helicase/nuclease subunit A